MIKISESLKDIITSQKAGKVINQTVIGANAGKAIGAIYGGIKGKKTLRSASGLPQINAEEFLKQHAPDVKHITKETLKGNKEFNMLQRYMLGSGLKKGNAFYIKPTKKRSAYIASSSEIAEPIISHEVGHHIEMGKNKKWRPHIMREYGAWSHAPVKGSEAFEAIRKGALSSYKAPIIGQGAGAIIGLLKGLKK